MARASRVYFSFGADNVPGTAHSFYGLALSPALCRGRGSRAHPAVRAFLGTVIVRYVLATIDWYAALMIHSQAVSTGSQAINTAFILRLTWDSGAQQWRILLKASAGAGAWLFGDMEAAFLHVESIMAEQAQRHNTQPIGAGSLPYVEQQEINR